MSEQDLTFTVLTPQKRLRLEVKLVLSALALSLNIRETADVLGWSDSKVMRWRGWISEYFGMNHLAVLVMLLNNQRFDPLRLAGHFPDQLGDMYDSTVTNFSDNPLDESQRHFMIKAFSDFPSGTDWSQRSCPAKFRAIIKNAGIKPPNPQHLGGIYALVMAAAAANGQIKWSDLASSFTVKVVRELPGGIKATFVGPPGVQFTHTFHITFPQINPIAELAD